MDIKIRATPLPPPPPPPVEVAHSRSFLLKQRRDAEADPSVGGAAPQSAPAWGSEDPQALSGNAIDFLIRKVDRSLDELEERPSEFASAVHRITTSPAGQITGYVIKNAATASVAVGKEALRASIPAARWVAREGMAFVTKKLAEEGGQGGARARSKQDGS